MNTLRTMLGLSLLLMLIELQPAFALQAAQDRGTVVGHLTHVEGHLLRYIYEDEDWVLLVKDSPVGIEDLLFCKEDSRAEIIIPNNTWIRIGSTTRLQIINLENDITEMDIDSGRARFYNKSTTATIKATTPFGSVVAPPRTAFDLYLQADTVHVKALQGAVTFNYLRDKSNHEVSAGGTPLMADYRNISAGGTPRDDDWSEWNLEMDRQWEKRLHDSEDDQNYLPETIRHESYTLRENGIWETVYYEGRNCSFWRPLYVPSYWSPYTVGRWTVWYGDQCWIPYEPFGYVTHHYGNWVYIDNCSRWYWAPPHCYRSNRDIYFLVIPFAWYPGRVSWIHRGDYVGWIPLAPFEPYYGYRSWGPLSRVVAKDPRRLHKDFHVAHCRYKHHAIIVKKNNLYGVTNYSRNRMSNRADTFIDNFRRETGINSRVISNFKTVKQRFAFDTRTAQKMPQAITVKPNGRMKPDDNLLSKKNPMALKTALLPERSKIPKQPLRTLRARTKKPSETQMIRDTAVSTFKPIQRYKPYSTMGEARRKLPVPPAPKQRISIPGEERRQVLPRLNRQGPASVSGATLHKREAPKTPTVQRYRGSPRLTVKQPTLYTNKSSLQRSSLAPGSPGFGRR